MHYEPLKKQGYKSLSIYRNKLQSHQQSTGIRVLKQSFIYLFIYLFGVLRRFQHCTGHITTGSWKGRGNQYIEFARVLYCKLPTNGKQLPAFPHKALTGIEPRPQRWEFKAIRNPNTAKGSFLTESANSMKIR